MYFIYSEEHAMSNGCYEKGGYPIIEISGIGIDSFDCNTNHNPAETASYAINAPILNDL
jgi:hypothetical protein